MSALRAAHTRRAIRLTLTSFFATVVFMGSCATMPLPTPERTEKAVRMVMESYSKDFPLASLMEIRVEWKRGTSIPTIYGQEVQGYIEYNRGACLVTLVVREHLYETRLAHLLYLCASERKEEDWTALDRAAAWWGRELLKRNGL